MEEKENDPLFILLEKDKLDDLYSGLKQQKITVEDINSKSINESLINRVRGVPDHVKSKFISKYIKEEQERPVASPSGRLEEPQSRRQGRSATPTRGQNQRRQELSSSSSSDLSTSSEAPRAATPTLRQNQRIQQQSFH